MKRVYYDVLEEVHVKFKQFAKQENRTLKSLLENAVNAYHPLKREVKKNAKNKR